MLESYLLPKLLVAASENPFNIDMTIEGMRSQNFSVGMFYFLVFAVFVFFGIALLFLLKDKTNKLKKGEKILFVWIFMGIVVALSFGAAQMMHGFLF
jgi:hypothetical protein